jgi:diguanylate cyclase (GGDEF)-like protein
MPDFTRYFGQANWAYAHRDQLASLARATPAAMVGYAFNTAVATAAFWGVIPDAKLLIWAACSIGLCSFVGIRALRRRDRKHGRRPDSSPLRSARRALALAVLLALPWTILATAWAGQVHGDSEVILMALCVGMAASGSVLLTPLPAAAAIYAATILVPLIFKCFFVLGGQYTALGALAVSFLVFLLALISTSARVFLERMEAVNRLRVTVKELSEARDETERMAMTDGLTGVANRRAFVALLDSACGKPEARNYTIFYLDLDRFKAVNDGLGHAAGDAVLQAVASRILNCVRQSDFVARLGGDEFAIVAQDLSDRVAADALAHRLVGSLSEAFAVDGQTVRIGASIGVAIAPECGASGDQLLQQADLAMYAAKEAGRCGYCIFEPDMLRSAEERRAIELGLSSAIANNEFELYYQPIRRLDTQDITGFECLIRWRHPAKGLLPPSQFLKVAEDMGIAREIGGWVISEACRKAASWPRDIAVGINLSPLQIVSGDITNHISEALRTTGLPAHRLELEITETSLLQNNPETLGSLRRLKEMGISIAMDDFGTGYSSLSYLVRFPFNRIKIDRLFISQLGRSQQSDLVVRAVAQLARSLNCTVVAEGIETTEQLRRLQALDISHGQGYLLGLPLSEAEATKLLAGLDFASFAQSA